MKARGSAPKWLTHTAPRHVDLTARLLHCPHNMAAGWPQCSDAEESKEQGSSSFMTCPGKLHSMMGYSAVTRWSPGESPLGG